MIITKTNVTKGNLTKVKFEGALVNTEVYINLEELNKGEPTLVHSKQSMEVGYVSESNSRISTT